ncbi:MAG: glutamate-5-semialdehyde dehydrogenase [Deltaproteobacteria bacterium]|nr:glutamate-5-semialdehyde dehydrogenase [Deltaproteobacteria bacterium]
MSDSNNPAEHILQLAKQAKKAARELAAVSGEARAAALAAMVDALQSSRSELASANTADLEDARNAGLPQPMIARLEITDKVFDYMQKRLKEIAALPDPVGRTLEGFTRPNGFRVSKVTVPIGVIGIIYESRPNVTTDAASVCLKSGNAVILRGGSESLRTNIVLADAMAEAASKHGLPDHAIQIIRSADRENVHHLLRMERYVDVLIPRGGKSLIERVASESRIPVIKHYDGICHQYLAADAPVERAVAVTVNSKCQRVEVCNALETLLVDVESSKRLLPELKRAFDTEHVTLRGCARTCAILPDIAMATEEDWNTEYLDRILSVRIVDGVTEAIEHINTYGSGHTDGIITDDITTARQFVAGVDASSVLVNASTRLSGGGDYGMGAVVGISTDKLHARGPVGPQELTSYKWVAYGDGHLRD